MTKINFRVYKQNMNMSGFKGEYLGEISGDTKDFYYYSDTMSAARIKFGYHNIILEDKSLDFDPKRVYERTRKLVLKSKEYPEYIKKPFRKKKKNKIMNTNKK